MRTITVQNSVSKLNWSPIFYFFIGIVLSSTMSVQLLMAVFPYVFLRSKTERIAYLLPSIFLYFLSVQSLIQFWIFVVGYHMFTYFIRLCRGNVVRAQQFYLALCSFALAYFSANPLSVALSYAMLQMIFYHETMKSFEWLKKKLHLISSIYALLVVSGVCLAFQYMPQYYSIFLTLGLIFICFGNSPLVSIASFFFISLLSEPVSFELFVSVYLLSLLKEQLGLMVLVYIGLFVSQVTDITSLLSAGLYLIFLLLLSKEGVPIQNEQVQVSNSKAFLHKQLMHFSMIFDHLGSYYENISDVESSFLKSMSKALHYTSKKCIHDENNEEFIKNQIVSILEGYEIDYEEINVIAGADGFIQIDLSLLHFHESEIEDVLLPLLNHILPTPVECASTHASFLHLGVLNVQFISTPPLQIDAYADSLVQEGNCSGDSFSVFHYARNVYCLISDGMGSGKEAAKISKCIINLFQRMIFSGIMEIEAMNCINKLLLSDAYATCDVLSFNRFKKSVTICKSAANPTYLIRNKELFAIWGNSLPIGIVAHIDVDHIHVQVEKGDFFVMSSDGVNVEEILRWMKESENSSARKECERMMEILKESERSDDSTILLAKVQ